MIFTAVVFQNDIYMGKLCTEFVYWGKSMLERFFPHGGKLGPGPFFRGGLCWGDLCYNTDIFNKKFNKNTMIIQILPSLERLNYTDTTVLHYTMSDDICLVLYIN